MQLDLAGKIALVTGSSQGIGLAIAEVLHAEGCKLVLNGRDSDKLEMVSVRLQGSVGASGDVSRPDEARKVVEAAVSTYGRLDILVCNVGGGRSVPPGQECYDEWQRIFALNFWSTTNMVEAARDALADTRGSIVCISSICGSGVIPGAPVAYSVAKAALNAYVRSICHPLGRQGVRINAVAPGNIIFEGSVWSRKLVDDPEAVSTMLKKDVALSRLGKPEEVAELVAFLASSHGSFATGGVWVIDGGQACS